MRVLLQVPLSPYSGYGNDGIGMARALIALGVDVYLLPTVAQAPLPPDVAALLTKETKGPFDLGLIHVDPMVMDATEQMRSACDVLVGWTMWEYSNMRNAPKRSTARSRYKNFDAMVGYDQVSSAGLAEYFRGPVLTQQGGYRPEDWQPLSRDWDLQEFYFCQIGVLNERKDPFVSIAAFGQAKAADPEFDKHARLMMKTSVPGLHSRMEDVYPGLRIFYDAWPVETVKEFYRSSHVLLAPSRGEGKNMPALEFMSTGGTVIATNWGGHREWLSPDYAYPLDYDLAPVSPRFPDTLNARASVDHMTQLMLHAFHNRAEVRNKGEIASRIIPQMSSWESVMVRLMDKIREIGPKGEALFSKYQQTTPIKAGANT